MFSLINKDNNPLKIQCLVPKKAAVGPRGTYIQIYGSYQVRVGYGDDLWLSADSNVNEVSGSNLGNSYLHPNYVYLSWNHSVSKLVFDIQKVPLKGPHRVYN